MKRIRLIGIALMALFAVGAVASATSSAALPEFLPTKGVELKGTAKGTATLETKGGTKVTCTGGSSGGEISGEKTASKIKIIFTGCESGGFKCLTPKAKAGELVTVELTGTLGTINLAKKEAGILFKPTVGTKFIEFECFGGIIKVQVTGSVICPITPVGVKSATFTLICKQTKGVQAIKEFEGGKVGKELLETSINNGAFEESGEGAEASIEAKKEGKATEVEIMV